MSKANLPVLQACCWTFDRNQRKYRKYVQRRSHTGNDTFPIVRLPTLCFQHSVIHSVSMRSLALLYYVVACLWLYWPEHALRAFATLESRTLTKLFYTCAYRLQSVSSDRAPSRYYIVAPVTSYEQSIWPAKLVRNSHIYTLL